LPARRRRSDDPTLPRIGAAAPPPPDHSAAPPRRFRLAHGCDRHGMTNFDAAVLAILRRHGRMVSYVIRNWLAYEDEARVPTARVLAALKRLEKAGAVKRAPSSYAVMISWQAVP